MILRPPPSSNREVNTLSCQVYSSISLDHSRSYRSCSMTEEDIWWCLWIYTLATPKHYKLSWTPQQTTNNKKTFECTQNMYKADLGECRCSCICSDNSKDQARITRPWESSRKLSTRFEVYWWNIRKQHRTYHLEDIHVWLEQARQRQGAVEKVCNGRWGKHSIKDRYYWLTLLSRITQAGIMF